MNGFLTFLRKDLIIVLDKLQDDTQPLWGILTPQHMLEHIVGSWRVSNGNAEARLAVSPEELQENRDFIYSDREFEENAKNPIMPPDGLWPLRKKSLEDAKQQLLKEVSDFFDYFDAHPNARPVHPIFGSLDKDGWLRFQRKHMQHHFRQFRMIDKNAAL